MALRLTQLSFLIFIVSLAWMKTPVEIGGLEALPCDFLFSLTMSLWLVALARRETALRWHPAFLLLAFYFAAMALSALFSVDPPRSGFKLLTQVYLLMLPVLAFNLVRTAADLKRVFLWWLSAAGAVAALGAATVLLFPLLGPNSILDWPLHNFGTLPPGFYPRIELSFQFPATLANYLGTALALLLIGERLGWLGRGTALILGAGFLLSAFFALTPGFGGVLFILGAWFWYVKREQSPLLAWSALVAGAAMPVVGVLLAAATPILHPTAPFLIHLPGLETPLAPSVRLLAWMQAADNFLASPIVGQGIGTDAVDVDYLASGCSFSCVSDAHNTFLSLAVQTGIVGLAAVAALLWFVVRRERSALQATPGNAVVFGLSIAWLSGFALHGLVGSFEDARHLWVLFGLILSASAMALPAKASDGAALRR